jgi:hypothetical protein
MEERGRLNRGDVARWSWWTCLYAAASEEAGAEHRLRLFFLNGAGLKGPRSFIPAVGELLQEGPENKRKLQTCHQFFTENTLKKIASKQSGPWTPPAACSNMATPPQSQPGTKPLGWAGDFTAAPLLLKILTQRKTLAQTLASSTARPPIWPGIAAA